MLLFYFIFFFFLQRHPCFLPHILSAFILSLCIHVEDDHYTYLTTYLLFFFTSGLEKKKNLVFGLRYFILFLPPQFSGARYVLYVHTVIMASSSNGISPLPPPFLSSCNIILSCIYIYIYIHFYWGEEREGGGRRKEEAILVYLLTYSTTTITI